MKGNKKKPRRKENPVPSKTPRIDTHLSTNHDILPPVWRVSTIDTEGRWGWHQMDSDTVWNDIHKKIISFESMTWVEIYKGGSHEVPITDLCPQAKRRLSEIKLDDIDDLFSLRLTGKKRIWGIKDRNIFKILWWDPNHEVCPSPKRYT